MKSLPVMCGALVAIVSITAGLREWLCPLGRPDPSAAVWLAPVPTVNNSIVPKVHVLRIGDLDGDGTRDLWVAVPSANNAESKVQILSGAKGSQIRAWDHDSLARTGCADFAASIGDVDLDGCDDLALSCQRSSVTIVSGRKGAQLLEVDCVGGSIWAIEAMGDVDADGMADFGLSLRCPDPRVQIRSSRSGELIHEWSYAKKPHEVPPGCFEFDWLLCRTDDLDGDGVKDIAVGAPPGRPWGKRDVASRRGFVETRSGRDGRTIWHVNGMWEDEEWPADLSPLADHDGDGITDLLIGAEGRIEVASGRTGELLMERAGPSDTDWGIKAKDAGDVDGDGRSELLVICTNKDIYYSGKPFGCGGYFEILSGLNGEVLRGDGLARNSYQGEVIPVGDLDSDGVDDLVQTFPVTNQSDVDFPCCDTFRTPSSWVALVSGAKALAANTTD